MISRISLLLLYYSGKRFVLNSSGTLESVPKRYMNRVCPQNRCDLHDVRTGLSIFFFFIALSALLCRTHHLEENYTTPQKCVFAVFFEKYCIVGFFIIKVYLISNFGLKIQYFNT